MKYLLFLLVWWLAATPAAAQAPRPAARPDSLSAPLGATSAAPDTVAALHRLFAAKRKRGLLIAGSMVGAAAGSTIVASAGTDHYYNRGEYAGIYGIMAAIAVGIEFLAKIEYNSGQERRVVADFQAHGLPPYLRRKLKPRYFQPHP